MLADWVLDNDLDPGLIAVLANADADGMRTMLQHPTTIVSASDAGAHLRMFCAAGDTTLLLSRHVRERNDLTLERAVWELTGRQAELFGFTGRGTLTEGAHADLAVFSLDDLAWLPEVLVDDVPGGGTRDSDAPRAGSAPPSWRASSPRRTAARPARCREPSSTRGEQPSASIPAGNTEVWRAVP